MRTSGSSRDKTWKTIREKGIELLSLHGYEKMNIRMLAREAGLQGGSLYNYFNSKEDFLSMIVCEIMENLLDSITEELEPLSDPVERASRFTHLMVIWHTEHRNEAFVAHMEVRNVSTERYEEYAELRRAFGTILKKIIRDGNARGDFKVADVDTTALAILTMLAGISNWYREHGRLGKEELAREHVAIVLKILGCEPAVLKAALVAEQA